MSRLLRSALAIGVLAAATMVVTARPAEAVTCAAESQVAWGTDCVATNYPAFIYEKVGYTGDDGRVVGHVCRPLGTGPYPVVVLNHAGVGGATGSELGQCGTYTAAGYVVLVSDYRIFDAGPSSHDDFCLGELDDVLTMLDEARQLSYVNENKIAMRGISHGGCITLLAHQQGVEGLQAAAVVNAPTDFAATWSNSNTKYTTNLCALIADPLHTVFRDCADWGKLRTSIETAVGDPPGPLTQAAYDARSPLVTHPDTAASDVPLMIVQGADDHLIPIQQTCAFVDAVNDLPAPAWDFTLARYGTPIAGYPLLGSAPTGCNGIGTWVSSPNPAPTFPGDHYFLVLDSLEHVTPPSEFNTSVLTADIFLRTKVPSP